MRSRGGPPRQCGRPPEAYLRLNPWGRIPTLEHDGLVLTESAAICLHLADAFPDARLAAPVGTRELAELYRRLLSLANTLQMTLMRHFYPEPATARPASRRRRTATSRSTST